jgi:uncharacterized protein YndB with AHSA1/START domain
MNMFKSLGLGVITLVAILAIISISLPRHIHLQRDIIINAPAEAAYEQISDLRNWPKWIPGNFMKSGIAMQYAGTPGNMESYNWISQRRGVAPGVVTITAAEPHKRLETKLEFDKGDKALSTFTLEETEDGTKLTWHFEKYIGDSPLRKFTGLLIDSTVGEEFEDGLANIKTQVESQQLLTDN